MMESILFMYFENNYYWHEGASPIFCRFYGKDKIIHKVKVTEDVTGNSPYWAVWDYERNRFINIWPKKGLVEMCYPYGMKPVEESGEGKLFRVNIEYLETVS